jgi:PEGA domain-containing protein
MLVAVVAAGLASSAEAQGVRHGPGHPAAVVNTAYYYRPYYYRPYWYGYPGFSFAFGFGYPWYGFGYPWFGFGYPWFPYYPYYPYAYPYPYAIDHTSAVRIEVTPREAEVYVDSYYAGIVDDYDGMFQRLHLPPGEHEITLYRDGYRTVHQNVRLSPGSTFKIKYMMEKLVAGDVAEPRPTPPNPPPAANPPQSPGGPDSLRVPPPNQAGPRAADVSATLSIRVQPENATVLIDGERWEGPQGQERLIVQVSEGPHQIRIQKEGYEPFTTNITVRRGETAPLNVSLRTR